MERSHLKDAIHTLRVCLLRDRQSPELNLALARLLERRALGLGRKRMRRAQERIREEALQCYRRVNAAAPTSKTYVAQGMLQQRLQRFEDALQSFERAVALEPKSAIAVANLAAANVDSGNIAVATRQFEVALKLDPERATAHFRYTRSKKFKAGKATSRYEQQLRRLLVNPNRCEGHRLHLHFALAKVLDDTGHYDEAWENYDAANRLKAGHSRSSRSGKIAPSSSIEGLAIDCERWLTREFFERRQAVGSPSRLPIFIVGMPRSGTTLTEQILSSHPDVAGAGELDHINRVRHDILSRPSESTDSRKEREADSYAKVLTKAPLSCFFGHAEGYLEVLRGYQGSGSRVTDKMPTNFIYLGLIALLFPNATVIHCRRDPMDVLTSCYCQNLNAPFCDLDQLVDYHRNYRRMMRHWDRVLPLRIHTIDYESMVEDPQRQTSRLLEHCGLPWNEKCMNFHANARAVHTPSKWQVRQPMYSTSVQKWRRFEKHLEPIAEQIRLEMVAEARCASREARRSQLVGSLGHDAVSL